MKGTLHKTESGWEVIVIQATLHGPLLQSLPLFDGDYYEVNRSDQYNHGKEVEFEIFDNRQRCNCACHRDPNITHFVACCNDGYKTDNLGHVNYYAKLVDQKHIPMKGGEGWDKILNKAIEDKATRPLTEEDAWPEYPTRLQQLQIQIAEECFRKYPNNELLYPTDELKDAYKAVVIDGLGEWRLDSYNKPEYPEVKIICPRCKTLMPCSCNSSWDTIMAESGSWDDSEILAYIIKNYNPPTKKQDNDK